eukprot:CAMPEP_0168604656 /NCGR_PEP_ID=MMETSP0420-20121227/15452_1 /TAXON_ID=498008 /ORGANISM="Pessonella sp." /LENGTH=137 /DNA_ID=CAMNT_0008643865 /DNA_START=702 /DNA_END=1113 /DNA_ORIENTATION=+
MASSSIRFQSKLAKNFPPAAILPQLLQNVHKVELVAVITGHGADSNQCAEFCNQTHSFYVGNAPPLNISFHDAGTQFGCAERVPEGVVPNEHGTWLYGRGGWCEGQQVSPHVLDITRLAFSGNLPKMIVYNATNEGH